LKKQDLPKSSAAIYEPTQSYPTRVEIFNVCILWTKACVLFVTFS